MATGGMGESQTNKYHYNNEAISNCLKDMYKMPQDSYVSQLYDLFNVTLSHIALKYFPSSVDAEDFIQDFWVDIYRIASHFRSHNGFGYLCRVATNRAISTYRKKHKEKIKIMPVDLDYFDRHFCGASKVTHEQLVAREAVHEAFLKLTPEERVVIESIYFENSTLHKMAKELGVSPSKIQFIKNKAIAKMKEYLQSRGDIDI